MLKVRGVARRVTNAGNASVNSVQSTLAMDWVIRAPTRIKAGAVANAGMDAANGEQSMAARNSPATTTLLRPVRAPAATPAALSMQLVTGEVPVRAPKIVPTPSASNAL